MIMRDGVVIGMANSSLGLFQIYVPIYAIYLFSSHEAHDSPFCWANDASTLFLLLFSSFFFFFSFSFGVIYLFFFLLLIPPLSRMTFPWIVRECLMRKFSVLGYLPFEDSLLMVIVPLVGDKQLCFLKR